MNTKFSIIVPLFNKEIFINQTIESVLSQKYNNYELIIIDDCSTDKSYSIVEDILNNRRDDRLKLSRNYQNKGVSFTRNKGIEKSTGDYIIFLDADDEIIDDELLTNLERFITRYSAEYIILSRNYRGTYIKPNRSEVISEIELISDKFYKVSDKINFALNGKFPFGGSASAAISRKIIGDYRFDIGEYYYEDWLFFMPIYFNSSAYYYSRKAININYDINSISSSYSTIKLPVLPKVYKFLDSDKKLLKIRKVFFWIWLNQSITPNLNFKLRANILIYYKKHILRNIVLDKVALKNFAKISIKLFRYNNLSKE